MKKLVCILIMTFSLASVGAKPASALMLDISMISATISKYVNMINEGAGWITDKVNQIKQMQTQFGDKAALLDIAKKYATEQGKKLLAARAKKIIEGTKKKNVDKMKNEQEQYNIATGAYYDAKLKGAQEDIKEAEKIEEKLQGEKVEYCNYAPEYERYKTLSDAGEDSSEAFTEYMDKKEKCEQTELAIKEIEELVQTQKVEMEKLQKEREKVGTDEDPKYKEYSDRIAALEAELEETKDIEENTSVASEKWDSEIANKYAPTEEHYTNFINDYFYDPDKISGNRVTYDTKQKIITGKRRTLLVNAAAHLLQVSASLRREIPKRTDAIDAIYQETLRASNENAGFSAYAGSRVENIKILSMYARLQAARLQYLAARRLLNFDLAKKTNGSYSRFNLEKYILDQKDIDTFMKEYNKRIDTSKVGGKNDENFI